MSTSAIPKKIILGLGALLLVASLATNAVLIKRGGLKENPEQKAQAEVQSLVAEVSKYIVLPEGEDPTIATVTDPEKLKDQVFFAQASLGDKVLIYTNAKKAILYNPTTRKIVEVAPINIGQPQTAPEASVPVEPEPTPEETEEEAAQ